MPKKLNNRPTIGDVARECGVGRMTVSRVVNGAHLVNPKTAHRVREAIRRLGYVPNEAAPILKGRAPKTIGLIVPDISDTFLSICAHAVQQLAAKHGYLTLLLSSERDPASGATEPALMKSREIAGLLIVPSGPQIVGQLEEARERRLPVVMLDRTFPGLDAAGLEPHLLIDDLPSETEPKLRQRLAGANRPTALFSLNNVTTIHVLQAQLQESLETDSTTAQ